MIKSKKQKVNTKVKQIARQWLFSLLPDDKTVELSDEEILFKLPKEPYFFSSGQLRLNSFTLKWFKRKIKKAVRKNKKSLMSLSLSEVLNA
tara:strand:+ start:1759 stop:2031 length:273 start_codon:yes stop_codon:yes gene_type:complete